MPPVLPRFSLFGRAISRSYFRSNVANFSSKPRAQLQRGYQNYRYQRFQETRSFLQAWARRPTFYAEMGGLGAVVGGVYYWNLETVPVSGRRRFNIISPEQEVSFAQDAFGEIMQQYGNSVLPPHDSRTRMVRRILDRLIPASGLTDQKWEVYVIDSDEVNAFVIPGGKVFVFTGIFPVARDENGLATVLGHEIAHNIAHHQSERLSRGAVLLTVAWLAETLLGSSFGLNRLLLQFFFLQPNGRKQETEADYIGLMLMAQSCYDPTNAPDLWKRMAASEKVSIPEFLSTHPSSHSREENMRQWLPEANQKREMSDCSSVLGYADDFRRAYEQLRW